MSPAWRHTGLVLAASLLLFGLAFSPEAMAAFHVWASSTAYNHCFLILPIAGYLLWERRAVFARLPPIAEPRAAWLAIPFALGWLVADRLGIMEGRQLAAMALLQCLLLGVLGRTLYWHCRAPFWYLVFLVPFGGFLVAPLQRFTAEFAAAGLSVLGITHYLHGTTIEISAGAFRIAQACAGLRFLIAAIAFAVLYALVIFRTTARRVIFIAVCVIVPVIANGFRALGIISLGYLEGSAKAAATDHVLYGYIFFSLVLMIIILLGLPFREDHAPPATPPAAPAGVAVRAANPSAVIAAGMVLAVTLAAPLTALMLDRAARATMINPPSTLAGCTLIVRHGTKLEAGAIRRDFACAKGARVTIIAFPPGTTPELIFDLRRKLGLIDLREAHLGLIRATGSGSPGPGSPGPGSPAWQLAVSDHGRRMAASALLIHGHLTLGTVITRLHMLRDRLTPGDAPLVIVVKPARNRHPTRAALRAALSMTGVKPASLRRYAAATHTMTARATRR